MTKLCRTRPWGQNCTAMTTKHARWNHPLANSRSSSLYWFLMISLKFVSFFFLKRLITCVKMSKEVKPEHYNVRWWWITEIGTLRLRFRLCSHADIYSKLVKMARSRVKYTTLLPLKCHVQVTVQKNILHVHCNDHIEPWKYCQHKLFSKRALDNSKQQKITLRIDNSV